MKILLYCSVCYWWKIVIVIDETVFYTASIVVIDAM